MAKDRGMITHYQAHRARARASNALRSPGWFAKWPIIGITMFLLGSLAFGALAYNVQNQGPLLQWDAEVLQDLHASAAGSPSYIIDFMNLGFYVGKRVIQILGVILSIYFLYKRYWRELWLVLIGIGGEATLWYLFSRFFDRPRPETQMGAVVHDPSFPSGHAATAFVCYGLLAYLLVPRISSRFWKWVLILAALLVIGYVGFSRLFMNGHYLTDVIAGYALGVAWVGLVFTLVERIFRPGKRENASAR